jgi:xylan 1,4-beta-xylosidase
MKRRDILQLAGASTLSTIAFNTVFSSNTFEGFETESRAAEVNLTKINIDWKNKIAKINSLLFGSNDYEILSPNKASDSVYQQRLKDLNVRLIRIHQAELCDRWTNSNTRSWDEAKIKAGFDASYPQKPTIVQNISGWTSWMAQDENGFLAASEYNRYAAFCAELVEILNLRQQRSIIYWEPFNEREQAYRQAGKLEELWKLYNKVAAAMKAKDSRIKIGGPVLNWDDDSTLANFLTHCAQNVDFISWHRYATGNAQESTDKIMAFPEEYGNQVRRFRTIVKKYIPKRRIPLFLSEYNINYSWDSGENRQNTHIGAVWFASVLKHLAEAGIEMAASWHLKDGIYGMIDPQNQLRPAANVFTWGINYLTGTVVKTTSDRSSIEALAVQQTSGKRSLLLINKSAIPTKIQLSKMQDKISTEKISVRYLDSNGVRRASLPKIDIDTKPLLLNPYSLALLRLI